MKTACGVMVMKDGRGWGVVYEDGRETCYGWMAPEDSPIHDPERCKRPTDVTWKGSPHIDELKSAKLVKVERVTKVRFLDA